ncbi:MAG: TIGR03084 family metal-binding protein [Actinomycetota bacterium]|nr:TIGR03084 family metal-binding protein [Actinomycetota bacterium]
MAVDMVALAGDLAAESAVTRALVAGLDEAGWHRATPAAGWDIADQVSHLAYFDEVTVQSAVAPEEFLAALADYQAAGGVAPDDIAARFRDRAGTQLLAWFDAARAQLIATFSGLDPALRLPWFGPAMSAASSLTARIMETWAHTQDIADALGVSREPTGRLRHVAHIGVGARAYSFAVNGKPAPSAPVRVELIPPSAPAAVTWAWGPDDAAGRVTGPALDFCLLVTQRRHRDDVDLQIEGAAAQEWMAIAQAFAGAAGTGRKAAGRR